MELLKSSYFSGSNGNRFRLDLYYDLLNQVIPENYSRIKKYLYWKSLGYSGSGAAVSGYIDGVRVGGANSISSNENKLLGTKEDIIYHNINGDGTFDFSAVIDTSWTIGDASVTGSKNLPYIPREASFNGEQNLKISGMSTIHNIKTINNGSMRQYLEYRDNNIVLLTKDIGYGIDNNISFSQSEILSIFPKKNITIRLISNNGNGNVGFKDKNINISYEGILKGKIGGVEKLFLVFKGSKLGEIYKGNKRSVE